MNLIKHKRFKIVTLLMLALLADLMILGGGPAQANSASPLFLVQESGSNDILLKFESGVLTTVGNIGFGEVRGLAYDATTDTLFGVSRRSNPRLISIDPNTGAGTPVSGNNYLPSGSNSAEISVDAAGALFGEGHLNDQSTVDTLLSVDKTTGIASVIGAFGSPTLSGLAFDHASGILYGTTFGGVLYTINPTVGTATSVGQITGSNGGVARIAFDQATGVLYGITFNEQLVTIDLTTLVATQVAQFSVPNQIYSLDFVTPLMPPSADAGGPYLVAVDNTTPLDGSGTDPDGGMLSYLWSSDEPGGTFSSVTVEEPDYTAGSAAGIFELSLTVTDPGNLSDTDTAMLVVYDPDGGFVTGGGWIDSPEGACPVFCGDAAGRANFGFVSKYKKGASIPTGNTEFNFEAGDLNFHSDEYEWLVINQGGSRAQYKGSGTINGDAGPGAGYKFMLWAQDLDPTGDDTFRIRIWYEGGGEVVIYDNGTDQALGGGNIKVHDGK